MCGELVGNSERVRGMDDLLSVSFPLPFFLSETLIFWRLLRIVPG